MGKIMERFLKPETYAVWSKDPNNRFKSTSGGAFTEFAKVILAEGGLVVGAQYNAKNMVEHAIVDNYLGLEKIRQSKYISSSPGKIFKDIKAKVLDGQLIAFCGSPCQVAGLYAYLGQDYDNLITLDFICRGMNSPKALKSWLDEIEKKEGSKVINVWFKYKDGGWKTSPKRTRLDFEDGHYRVEEGDENLFMHGYLTSNLYIRPSCGNCRFKGVPRNADITLADFWGIEKELDDDKGTSMVLVNSEKAKILFEKANTELEVHEKDFDIIFKGNPMFKESVSVPVESQEFLKDLDFLSFSDALKKYNKSSRNKSVIKRLFRKTIAGLKRLVK